MSMMLLLMMMMMVMMITMVIMMTMVMMMITMMIRVRWLLRLHFPGCYPQIDSTPVPLCYNAQFTACIIYIVMYSNYVYSVWYLYPHMDSFSSILPCYNVLHWRSTLYNTKKYKMWIKIMFWNSDWIQTKNTIVSLQKTPQNTGHLLIVVVLPSERLQFHCITIENTCHLFAALRFRP